MTEPIEPPGAFERSSITILCSLWNGFAPVYDVSHVRALSRQLHQYVHLPYQLILLTNFATTPQDAEVDGVLPLQPELPVTGMRSRANCFRRLLNFNPEFSSCFGTPWIASLDLDVLFLDDCTSLFELAMCDFGFSILRGRFAYEENKRPYNGGFYALRVGDHSHVWTEFDWATSPQQCAATGWIGSDQVWMSLKVPHAPTIGPEHGVYFAKPTQPQPLEASARLVTFPGPMKPWNKSCKNHEPQLWREYQRFAR